MLIAIGILIGVLVGGIVAAIASNFFDKSRIGQARRLRRQMLEDAKREADAMRREAEIAAREEAVSELERRLADDWGDVETLAAHRRARDELQALLARWEELFERSQA